MALSQVYTAITGDTITAARWNNEFGNIYGNGTDVAFPLTKAVSFAGYTITWDSSGATQMISTTSQGISYTPGSKTGAPTTTGSIWNTVASTFTDNNTVASGTVAAFASMALQRPTLAASNSSVITTDATTFYIANAPLAGSNETLTNAWALWVDDGNVRIDGQLAGAAIPHVNELRLTLTSGTPVTAADVTGAGTLYWTPYKGKHVALYDGTIWKMFSTAEVSLTLTLTSGKPYDIWGYISSGAPALETLVWTNDTTRATPLMLQDGVLVKSGDATRRYLGTLYASGANTTEDSQAKRYLANYYHPVRREMLKVDSTNTWTYSLAAWRAANGSATNQLDFVVAASTTSEHVVTAMVTFMATSDSATVRKAYGGVGLSTSTVNSAQIVGTKSTNSTHLIHSITSWYGGRPNAGRQTLVWLEYSDVGGSGDVTTWYGDNGTVLQCGITGEVWA